MNYDAAFKNIDDTLWKDAGCGSELDYIEQTSWILFLKYLDDLEKENKAAAELSNKTYSPILSNEFSWETWAAPKKTDGSLDYNAAKTGDDLKDFVNTELFVLPRIVVQQRLYSFLIVHPAYLSSSTKPCTGICGC